MSKRSPESSSLGSSTVNAKACYLVSRHGVSVGRDYSSNLKSPESTRDSQVWTWEESSKSGRYSVQHASENREYDQEDSGGPSNTLALGNRDYTPKVVQNMKDQLRHDESSSDKSMDSEKMHISIWTRFMASSMQAALHMEFENSEFESVKGLFGITRMMIEGK